MNPHQWRSAQPPAATRHQPTRVRRRPLLGRAALVSLLAALAGSGSDERSDDGQTGRERLATASPSTSAPPSAASSGATGRSGAAPPGVTETPWPRATTGVTTMLAQMPKRVAGARLSGGPMGDGPYAFLSYARRTRAASW